MKQYLLSEGGKLLHFPNGLPMVPRPLHVKGFNWLLVGTNDRYEVIAELHPADIEEYESRERPLNEHILCLANGNYLVVQEPPPPPKHYSQDTSYSDGIENLPGGIGEWL